MVKSNKHFAAEMSKAECRGQSVTAYAHILHIVGTFERRVICIESSLPYDGFSINTSRIRRFWQLGIGFDFKVTSPRKKPSSDTVITRINLLIVVDEISVSSILLAMTYC